MKLLAKQTLIYGIATVAPRILSVILVPLYIEVLPSKEEYGEISVIFSWIILLNVVLAYGMETAFFRFYHKNKDRQVVITTSGISIVITSLLFLLLALSFKNNLAELTGIQPKYLEFTIWVLCLDALVIMPFALLRAQGKALKYSFLKLLNVAVNLGLNLFFLLLLPFWAATDSLGFLEEIYVSNFEISYIFISLLIASLITFLILLPYYFKLRPKFDVQLWKSMLRYALPVLFAGLAFAINEAFDKILLEQLLPPETARATVGAYAACYKLGLFMTLFATAFRLGVEPYFFSKAEAANAKKVYAEVTRIFVICGALIMLSVMAFIHPLKQLLIPDENYWVAMPIVPIILMANFCLGIYFSLSVWYKVTDRTKFGAYISGVAALLTIGLNFWLIPVIGFMASAWATLAAYAAMMLLSYILGQKFYPIDYKLKDMLFYLIISLALSISFYYLLEKNTYLVWSLWLAFLLLVFVKEKKSIQQYLLK